MPCAWPAAPPGLTYVSLRATFDALLEQMRPANETREGEGASLLERVRRQAGGRDHSLREDDHVDD